VDYRARASRALVEANPACVLGDNPELSSTALSSRTTERMCGRSKRENARLVALDMG